MQLSPFMVLVFVLSFFAIAFFTGMMMHSSFMHENKRNIKKDSRKAWTLSMVAGLGITFWLFYYGYSMNQQAIMRIFFSSE